MTKNGTYRGIFECKFCGSRHIYPKEGYTTREILENYANEHTAVCEGDRKLMKAPHWEPTINGGPMLNKHQYLLVDIIEQEIDALV